MKWQDTSPSWQAQAWSALSEKLEAVGFQSPAPESGPWVLIKRSAIETVRAHLGQIRHEQGGLLLGEIFARPSSQLDAILVCEAIASVQFDASAVSLKMQSDIWNAARERLSANRLVVGWYHSHPDLGAFFSGTDRRTQAAFFSQPYSLGWVVDPIRAEQAWYSGPHSRELEQSQCSLVPD